MFGPTAAHIFNETSRVSSCVWGDQTRYFKAKHELFLTECFCASKPDQTRSTVVSLHSV